MKAIAILSLFLAATLAVSHEDFQAWMKKFGKSYENQAEYDARFHVYKKNMKHAEHAAYNHPKAQFGATKFMDMSRAEFQAVYLPSSYPMGVKMDWQTAALYSDDELSTIPTTMDWRTKGAVTDIKNQGDCGSCFAFSTTGNLEGQWFLAGHPLVGLSEQNIVDCDHHCLTYEGEQVCDAGCEGGLMPNAFMYIMGNGGIDSETSYPYYAEDQKCKFQAKNVAATVSNWTYIAQNETQMAAYCANNGPVSIAVDAEAWQYYLGGVFDDPWCGTQLDHGVLIVGYGNETDIFGLFTEYWIVKNSWGTDWGDDGYIYLEKGSDSCGIDSFPCSTIVDKVSTSTSA